MMSNNIVPIGLGVLSVTEIDSTPPLGNFGVLRYPKNGGIFIGADDKMGDVGFGQQAFLIEESFDGGGINIGANILCGNVNSPMTNFGVVGLTGAAEVVSVIDTNFVTLFAVTGNGITKVNKISRTGATPTVVKGVAIGTTGTVVMSAGATDIAFKVAITAGGTGLTTGVGYHVTFATPFPSIPVIVFSPEDTGNSSLNGFCISGVTVNGFDMFFNAPPTAGGTSTVNFIVVG